MPGKSHSPNKTTGFTLVEAMCGMMVFVMISLGIYQMMIQSYNYARITRYRDDARAVLVTFVDQFQRLQTSTEVPVNSQQYYTRWIFKASPTGTAGNGAGLQWGALSDQDVYQTPNPPTGALQVTLGAPGSSITASVTRTTTNVDSSTGQLVDTESDNAAGCLIVATFTITYSFGGRNFSDSLTTLRTVP